VAIKSIKKKGKEEKDIKVMRDEIEILKKLKHENIILLLDSFETNAEFILVTELGQGELFNIIEDDQSLEEV
jgi:fused-like protein